MNDPKGRIAILVLGALLSPVLSCTSTDNSRQSAFDRYQVRGQVARPVDPAASQRLIWLEHEPIPQFVGITGEVEGMESMTMSFIVAEDVDLADLEQGTKILFELTVDWSASVPGRVTAIQILPSETRLSFEATD